MRQSVETAAARFVAHKRALGRKYNTEEFALRLLVRFTQERGVLWLDQLTPALLDEFLASRPRRRPRSFNHLVGIVGCLLDWAVGQQLIEASPLRTRRRRVSATRVPFIFDKAQARRLLTAAAALPDNPRALQRGPTYHVTFALCYGLGLRAGEVCGLRIGDVDRSRNLLTVRGGKFGKSRLVPHGPRIGRLVGEHLERRNRGGELKARSPLFTFDGHRPVNPSSASQTFHRLVGELGIEAPVGVAAPTLHGLRHSFAVGCLLRWYREGLDPAARLHQLSTFMGHVDPTSTAVYLTITPALMEEASRRFEAFAGTAFTEVER